MTTVNELKNAKLKSWLQGWIDLCKPANVEICDGSQAEYDRLCDLMVKTGTFIKLKSPANSYLARSDKSDVARVEERTFICSEKEEDAGPTNHWKDPKEMKAEFNQIFDGCMAGRTMYVIPILHGQPRIPDRQVRHRDHRFPVRRREHGDHDPRLQDHPGPHRRRP
jgi:phosphoenolpyruvate carboxykinase (GTP)